MQPVLFHVASRVCESMSTSVHVSCEQALLPQQPITWLAEPLFANVHHLYILLIIAAVPTLMPAKSDILVLTVKRVFVEALCVKASAGTWFVVHPILFHVSRYDFGIDIKLPGAG